MCFQELEYCQTVILSVVDEAGVSTIIDQLLEASRSESLGTRRAAATLLCAFTSHTRADYSQHVPQLIRGLILSFVDKDPLVLQMSWDSLSSVTKVSSKGHFHFRPITSVMSRLSISRKE